MPRSRAGRRFTATLIAAATAMLATTALTVTAAAAPGPVPKETKETARVLSWLTVKKTDTRPKQVRVGADWTIHSHLYTNIKGKPGKKIGDAFSHCGAVEVRNDGHVALCHRVLRTDDGSISLTDAIDRVGKLPHGGKSAITGGTGKYAGAEGQADITLQGDIALYVIRLED
ncbi:hypothetical protein ACLGI4_21020 [Streptomyces sp. HMX112]|uniref:hypothetical protein n=1 Tax=Streptomyces sp. HMX112 TaxID=3390850 RepID=UPI003A7FF448